MVHRDDPRKEVTRGGHHRGELYQHRIRYGQSIVIYRNWSEQSGQTRGSWHTQVSQKCFKLHFDDMTAINCIHITYLDRFSDKFPPKALVLSLAASNYFFSLEVSYRTTHSWSRYVKLIGFKFSCWSTGLCVILLWFLPYWAWVGAELANWKLSKLLITLH